MGYGPAQVYSCSIASGASTSSAIDLGDRPFRQMAVYYGTMSTGAAVSVWGSANNSSFYQVHERVNTAPVQYQALTVATSVSGAWAAFASPPHRYVQFTTSAVVDGGVAFTVVCQE